DSPTPCDTHCWYFMVAHCKEGQSLSSPKTSIGTSSLVLLVPYFAEQLPRWGAVYRIVLQLEDYVVAEALRQSDAEADWETLQKEAALSTPQQLLGRLLTLR